MSVPNAKCSVFGCKDEHTTLHHVPAAEDMRVAWIYSFLWYVSDLAHYVMCVCMYKYLAVFI